MLTILNFRLREGLEKRYPCIFSAAYPDEEKRALEPQCMWIAAKTFKKIYWFRFHPGGYSLFFSLRGDARCQRVYV